VDTLHQHPHGCETASRVRGTIPPALTEEGVAPPSAQQVIIRVTADQTKGRKKEK